MLDLLQIEYFEGDHVLISTLIVSNISLDRVLEANLTVESSKLIITKCFPTLSVVLFIQLQTLVPMEKNLY